MNPRNSTCSIHDKGSNGALYCEPPKIHEPEILHQKNTWYQNFLPKKMQELNTSILIYSTKQTLRPKKYVTDLLTKKNSKGVKLIFNPKNYVRTSSCVLRVPQPPGTQTLKFKTQLAILLPSIAIRKKDGAMHSLYSG